MKRLNFMQGLFAIILINLMEYWLFNNVDLVRLWISRVLGTRRQSMAVFSGVDLIFFKSGTSLQLKQGKLSVKAGQNRGLTAMPKPLVAVDEVQCDCINNKKDWSNKKSVFPPLSSNALQSASLSFRMFIIILD